MLLEFHTEVLENDPDLGHVRLDHARLRRAVCSHGQNLSGRGEDLACLLEEIRIDGSRGQARSVVLIHLDDLRLDASEFGLVLAHNFGIFLLELCNFSLESLRVILGQLLGEGRVVRLEFGIGRVQVGQGCTRVLLELRVLCCNGGQGLLQTLGRLCVLLDRLLVLDIGQSVLFGPGGQALAALFQGFHGRRVLVKIFNLGL